MPTRAAWLVGGKIVRTFACQEATKNTTHISAIHMSIELPSYHLISRSSYILSHLGILRDLSFIDACGTCSSHPSTSKESIVSLSQCGTLFIHPLGPCRQFSIGTRSGLLEQVKWPSSSVFVFVYRRYSIYRPRSLNHRPLLV